MSRLSQGGFRPRSYSDLIAAGALTEAVTLRRSGASAAEIGAALQRAYGGQCSFGCGKVVQEAITQVRSEDLAYAQREASAAGVIPPTNISERQLGEHVYGVNLDFNDPRTGAPQRETEWIRSSFALDQETLRLFALEQVRANNTKGTYINAGPPLGPAEEDIIVTSFSHYIRG